MNIKDLKQELHQIGIDINDSAIVSTLKEAGLTVEDVTDKSLDVVIEIFEEKYPQSTKSTSLTTQHSEIPEKPIASTRSTGSTALATAVQSDRSNTLDRSTNTAKPILRGNRQRVTQARQEAQQAVNETGLDIYVQQSRQFVNDRIATKEQIREAAVNFVLDEYEALPHEIARDLAKGVKGINYDAPTFRGYAEDFDRASGADRLLSELLGGSSNSEAD